MLSTRRSIRRMATLVAPRDAHNAIAAGKGQLLDIRLGDAGVTLHAAAVRMPYEAILGRDTGIEEKAGTVSRDELLKGLDNGVLGEKEYHDAAALTLEQVRAVHGNPNLTHEQAQAQIRELNKILDNPPAFAKFYTGFASDASTHKIAALKSAYSGKGKVDAEMDAFVTTQREAFSRFLNMKPVVVNRFSPPPTTEAEADDRAFAFVFVRAVRGALGGAQLDHEGVAAALKKKIKPDGLKTNKAFVEQFFLGFSADLDKAHLDATIARLSSAKEPTVDILENAAKQRSAWAWYLSYSTTPSKAQLAANLNDTQLARLAGRFHANLTSEGSQQQTDAAREALKASIPATRPLFVICDAQAHSERVAAALEAAGAKDVNVVEGGADRWLLEGVPAQFSAAMQGQIEDALKKAMHGAPTALADINE